MFDMKNGDKSNEEIIDDLSENIEKFKQKNENFGELIAKPENKEKYFSIVYNVFADLLGATITAFILYKIFCHFFDKNVLVLAILLLCCLIAGLYNSLRLLYKKK